MTKMEVKELVLDRGNLNVVENVLKDLVRSRPDLVLVERYNVVLYAGYEEIRDQQVVILSGGLTGREPVHALYVGDGKLTGAVCGELLASPSVQQIFKAIRIITGLKGCLVILKNNLGDSMNFGLAIERAQCEGFKVKMIVYGKESYNTSVAKEDIRDRDLIYLHQLASALAKDGHTLEFIVDAITFLIQRRKYGVGVMDIPRHLKDPISGFVAGGYDSSFAAAFLLNRHFQSTRRSTDMQLGQGGIHVPFISSSATIVDRISYYMALFNKKGDFKCSSRNDNKVWARNQLKRLTFRNLSEECQPTGKNEEQAFYDTTMAHECNKWSGLPLPEQCSRLRVTKVRLSLDGKILLACYKHNSQQAFHIEEKKTGGVELVPLPSNFIGSKKWCITTFTQKICVSNLEDLRSYLILSSRSESDASSWMEMEGGSRLWYYTLDDVRPKNYETYTQGAQMCEEIRLCADPIIENNKHQEPLKQKDTLSESQLKFVLIENYFTPSKRDVGSLKVMEPEMEPEAIGFEDKPSTVKAINEGKGNEEIVDQTLAADKVSASWSPKALQNIQRGSQYIRSCEVGPGLRYYHQADRHSQWVLILNEFLKTQVAWKSGTEHLPIKKYRSPRHSDRSETQLLNDKQTVKRMKSLSRPHHSGSITTQRKKMKSRDASTTEQKQAICVDSGSHSMDHMESARKSHLTSRAMIHQNILKSVQQQPNLGCESGANDLGTNNADKLSLTRQQKSKMTPPSTGLHQNEANVASEYASGRTAPFDESFTTTAPILEPIGNIASFEIDDQPHHDYSRDLAQADISMEGGWNVHHTRNCKCRKKLPKETNYGEVVDHDKKDADNNKRSGVNRITQHKTFAKKGGYVAKVGKPSGKVTTSRVRY